MKKAGTMKHEFSFYEFVGILVPSVIFLFFTSQIFETVYGKQFIHFAEIGESIVFFIVAYGIGQILHSLGNLFELIFWKLFKGKPTQWLTVNPRFGGSLFDNDHNTKIKAKVFEKFGSYENRDYGREVYNLLSLQEKTTEKRIDLFNANYSMFRGLTVSFYLLTAICAYYLGWEIAILPFILGLLGNIRMFRFAKLYAQEIYLSFFNLNSKTID